MAKTQDDYLHYLQTLLPAGPIWPRDDDATLTQLLQPIADGLQAVDQRSDDLLAEMDPRTTLEMIGDWEVELGLPDPCMAENNTIQERRNAIIARITQLGSLSRLFFIDLAAKLGYTITIQEFRPFTCGRSRCGDTLGGGSANRYNWRVIVPQPNVIRFKCGASRCGDSLGKIRRATELECIFRRICPPETQLYFSYTGV